MHIVVDQHGRCLIAHANTIGELQGEHSVFGGLSEADVQFPFQSFDDGRFVSHVARDGLAQPNHVLTFRLTVEEVIERTLKDILLNNPIGGNFEGTRAIYINEVVAKKINQAIREYLTKEEVCQK